MCRVGLYSIIVSIPTSTDCSALDCNGPLQNSDIASELPVVFWCETVLVPFLIM